MKQICFFKMKYLNKNSMRRGQILPNERGVIYKFASLCILNEQTIEQKTHDWLKERKTDKNRRKEKQTDWKTERQDERKKSQLTERQRKTDRKTERPTDRKTERQKDRQTERQKDRHNKTCLGRFQDCGRGNSYYYELYFCKVYNKSYIIDDLK